MPNLSVLMPAYNSEKFVFLAVQSTLAALPNDAELVVCNDGSSDRTLEILSSFQDKRLKILDNGENIGIVSTLNKLVEQTSSQFIARMDSDDICMPTRFKFQMSAIASNDLVFGRMKYISESGHAVGPEKSPGIPPENIGKHLILGNCLSHPTMIARRARIENLGGYRQTTAEDFDLWLRLLEDGAVIRKSWRTAVKYRLHENQISMESSWNRTAIDDQIIEAYGNLYQKILGIPFKYERNEYSTIEALFDSQKELDRSHFDHEFLKNTYGLNRIWLKVKKERLRSR